MYKPLQYTAGSRQANITTTMAQKGVNKNVWPQFLDVNSSQNCENYIPTSEGLLKTRKGLSRQLNVGGVIPASAIDLYHDKVKLFAYGTTLAAWDETTGTTTNIKTDFTADDFEVAKYGDYFFLTSILNGLWRISRTMNYSQVQNNSGQNSFTVTTSSGTIGATLTGGTSGAIAAVVSSSLVGTTYTVTCTITSGTFQHGESITSGTITGGVLANINPFVAGRIVTGQNSGAVGYILEHTDSGATGTLTLGQVSGTFQNGEELVDDASPAGRGVATSALGYTATYVSAAPKAAVMQIIGNRMYLGNISTDNAGVRYSPADTEVNPPFTGWTTSSDYTGAGPLSYRNGGTVRAIRGIGGLIVVLQDDGKFAFSIEAYQSSGSFYKIDNTQLNRKDFGGSRAAIVTDEGMFYANEAGLWQLASVGQTNVPFSNQEFNLTGESLGKTYFDNIDLSDADLTYDQRNRVLILTCAKNSNINNFCIVYNIDSKAFSFFTGWGVKRFLNVNNVIYGTDVSAARIYKCLDGYSDDGNDISRYYQQEINFGSLSNRLTLKGCYAQGLLSTTSELDVAFDIYDEEGRLFANKAQHTWSCQLPDNGGGWGEVGFGESGYGGDSDLNDLVNSFDGCRPFVRGAQRIILKISSQGQDMHAISWLSFQTEIGSPIRRRKMARITS